MALSMLIRRRLEWGGLSAVAVAVLTGSLFVAAGPTAALPALGPADGVLTTITTQVSSGSIGLGGSFHDTATLSPSATDPARTGTVTFDVYSPDDTNCDRNPVFTSLNVLNAAGTSATSDDFTPTAAGTYLVRASYSGDANYPNSATQCGDSNESVTVGKGSSAITTQVSPSIVPLGGSFTDTASLPATNPSVPARTGTVTFDVYGPDNAQCSGEGSTFTSLKVLNAAGTSATSDGFTPTAAGTYRVIASYSGDANYDESSTECNDAGESVVVTTTTITTQVSSGSIGLGGSFHDTATLAATQGGPAPTGTVTFDVYSPDDTNCDRNPVFTSTNVLNGAGTSATSDDFTPTAAGTYLVRASYSGDANYPNSAGQCSDDGESVTVTPLPQIAVTETVSPASRIEPAGSFTFTVTVNNPSTVVPVTITALVDDIYGDLATRPASTCGALIGETLAPGATSAPCTFTGSFTGSGGDSQTDTVTVTGTDEVATPELRRALAAAGTVVTATAQATVSITNKPTTPPSTTPPSTTPPSTTPPSTTPPSTTSDGGLADTGTPVQGLGSVALILVLLGGALLLVGLRRAPARGRHSR